MSVLHRAGKGELVAGREPAAVRLLRIYGSKELASACIRDGSGGGACLFVDRAVDSGERDRVGGVQINTTTVLLAEIPSDFATTNRPTLSELDQSKPSSTISFKIATILDLGAIQ